jgi:hypothetical protein
MARHLFIVSRQSPDLYRYLAREFSSEPEVTVILDRRRSERPPAGVETEPAALERRAKGDVATRLSTLGYAFVRIG